MFFIYYCWNKTPLKEGQVDEKTFQLKFEKGGNSKEYEMKAICDNVVYTRELKGYLLGFYYLVLWKGYPKEKNIQEPVLAIQHF